VLERFAIGDSDRGTDREILLVRSHVRTANSCCAS
jgi:hypothetical protein